MKSALDPNCRLKSIWKAASSEETQTLSLCQSRVPGDGVLLARLLSRQGVGPPPLPRPARQHHRAGPGGQGVGARTLPPPLMPWTTHGTPQRLGHTGTVAFWPGRWRQAHCEGEHSLMLPRLSSGWWSWASACYICALRQLSSPGLPDEDIVTSAVEIGSLRLREVEGFA